MPVDGSNAMYKLKLYVVGQKPNTVKAIHNLRTLLKHRLRDGYSLQVIDLLENPQLAEEEMILATPTLVRSVPLPVRRIVGDLSDAEKVLIELGLVDRKRSTS